MERNIELICGWQSKAGCNTGCAVLNSDQEIPALLLNVSKIVIGLSPSPAAIEGSESLRLRDFSFVFYPLLSPLTALEPLSADGAPHGRSFSEQMSDIFSVQSLTFLRRGIIYTKLAP